MNRRDFLAVSSLGAGLTCTGIGLRPATAAGGHFLRAGAGQANLVDTESPTEVWGYNSTSPGPVIRVTQNQLLEVRLRNELPLPTTVHWHGIRIDNAMDGVGHLTQAPVEPGEEFVYQFSVPDAGTYWYHPHFRSAETVARGLYGLLIVDEVNAPAVDQDIALVIDDWRLNDRDELDIASLGNLHDAAHAGRLGNVLTVNGHPGPTVGLRPGARVRLRLLNAANSRVLDLEFAGLSPTVVALDGQPIEPTASGGQLRLSPGARADLLVDVELKPEERATLALVARGGNVIAADFIASGEPVRDVHQRARFTLEPNPLPIKLSSTERHRVELTLEGGAMGHMRHAVYKGEQLSMQELLANGQVWSMNGRSGMSPKPLFSVSRGRTVELGLINDTGWAHAMHLHGHHARIQSHTRADRAGHWRDTVLIDRGERFDIAFVADNPGKWMLHCHMLEHQEAGMAAWFEVT